MYVFLMGMEKLLMQHLPTDIRLRHIVPAHDFPAHPEHHAFAELVYVLTGRYESQVNGRAINCTAGEVCFYPPHTAHQPRHRYASPPVLIVLQWDGGPRTAPWDAHFTTRDLHSRIVSTLTWMWNTASLPVDARQALHTPLLQALSVEISGLMATEPEPTDPAERAAAIIRHRLPYQFSIEEVAQHIGIDPAHLSRLFRVRFGVPPIQYTKRLRLEKAVNLIRSTRLPLKTIARQVGYSSGQHLSTLIKQMYGRPPSQLRTPRR